MLRRGETPCYPSNTTKKINHGFSLIEVLIVMSIAAILAASALPVYSGYLTKKKRLYAELALQRVASALEEYFVVHYSYQGFSLDNTELQHALARNQYALQIHTNTEHFHITATPINTQAQHDQSCGSLSLTETGQRGISGTGWVDACWA